MIRRHRAEYSPTDEDESHEERGTHYWETAVNVNYLRMEIERPHWWEVSGGEKGNFNAKYNREKQLTRVTNFMSKPPIKWFTS